MCYIKAFHYIPSHLVALFNVLTPVYVVLIHDLRHLQLHPAGLAAALLSVAGATILRAKDVQLSNIWTGFILMQAAGIAFAFGQVAYRDWKRAQHALKDREVFALLTLGGASFAWLVAALLGDWDALPTTAGQWTALVYLGERPARILALEQRGRPHSPGTLAAFNNAVVPLAIIASFAFGEARALQPRR